MSRKPYICYACRDGHHMLCASDLNKKNPCQCDVVWHVEVTKTEIKHSKGTIRIAQRPAEIAGSKEQTCRHDRLNEDGVCRTCGADKRGI